MEKKSKITPTCVDCGTQNCKYKVRTYPKFCLTANSYYKKKLTPEE